MFGAFNESLTKQNKGAPWQEIHDGGKSSGAFNGKEFSYIEIYSGQI
jgi:hypothetical protein